MATSTGATLITRLSQRIGDYLSEAVTTALTTSTSVVCTTLAGYTALNDVYNRQWCYITDEENATAYRKISDSTSAGTLTVLGANFADDGSDLATFEIHKYDRNNKIRALNLAARHCWPDLFKIIRDTTLITGNILPNSSFEDWSSSSYPDWYSVTNCTATEETTTYRGIRGSSSANVDATSADGNMYISSTTYPKLLDLMGKMVSIYVWAYPENANDGFITIDTVSSDGSTTQTLNSTTTCPAGYWTLLKLEDQALNDDLSSITIKFRVHTSGGYVYFDNARLTGLDAHEYILPLDLQNPLAQVDGVYIQSKASQDKYADDTMAYAQFDPLFGYDIRDDATTKYLVTPTTNSGRLLRIEGIAPLESNITAATSTMTIEDPHIDLLIELAAAELFSIEKGLPSTGDRDEMERREYAHRLEYERMKGRLRLPKPNVLTHFDRRLL